MTPRCAYGRALVAVLNGVGDVPEGYEYLADTDDLAIRLSSHDRFCRQCSAVADSTNPDAVHLRRRSA